MQKKFSTNFHTILCKDGRRATKETIRFGGNMDHVTLALGLVYG